MAGNIVLSHSLGVCNALIQYVSENTLVLLPPFNNKKEARGVNPRVVMFSAVVHDHGYSSSKSGEKNSPFIVCMGCTDP